MSNNVRIQDDLFEAVNGEWLAEAVIPDDRPATGAFNQLDQEVERKLMCDFAQFSKGEKSSDVLAMNYAISLYKKITDTAKRNEDGIKPLLPLLAKIKAVDSIEKLNEMAEELLLANVDLPVNLGVEADMNDATKNSLGLSGPGIILPDTTYYSDENPAGKQLLAAYGAMVTELLSYTDLSQEEQKQYLEDALAFDKLVSKSVKSQLEWADYVKVYNPTSLKEVSENLAPFDFEGLLRKLYGDKLPQTIIVYDPRAIKEFSLYFNEENFKLYIHWAYVKTLVSGCGFLSEQLAKTANSYRRTLTGVKAEPAIEKQAYRVVGRVFSEAVGVYYGRTYFGEEAKKDIISLVKKIIETWKGRVDRSTFLERATKDKAILKLSTMSIKMGYPDEVNPKYGNYVVEESDSYYSAMSRITALKIKEMFAKLNEPVDKNEWQMPGNMVNACYDPSRNDITFPAAILQKPFYSIEQSIYENLGGIGAVISHEISHAFDNNGAQFDENGNLFNWWTTKDLENFEKLTKQMIEQWDGLETEAGKVNGELVVSENIADNGGVAVTIEIMHTLENPDFEKYFTNWARVWCQKATLQYSQLLLASDVHSPAKLRANIPVQNFKEWYETFNVTENDKMYIPEDKRIIVW